MQILTNWQSSAGFERGVALTLGNFDGVHLGHKAIIEETKKAAATLGLPAILMTFGPHPVSILQPEIPPFLITSFKQKAALIEKLNIDTLLVIKFDKEFAQMTAEEFVKNIIVDKLQTRHIVIGYDFNFGRGREGNAAFLKNAAENYEFGFTRLESEKSGGEPFSSTLIRNHLRKGEIDAAENLLGHPFVIEGKVLRGAGNGKILGFPTANIDLHNYVRPKFGVYSVETQIENDPVSHKSIANIGIKPTIGGSEKPLLEVHIMDFSENIYGSNVKVSFKEFIREEMKFPNLDSLKKQIAADIEKLR